ncbi:hypothetical protein P9112_011140 [Eukaryota sp. TZLM1-RC]
MLTHSIRRSIAQRNEYSHCIAHSTISTSKHRFSSHEKIVTKPESSKPQFSTALTISSTTAISHPPPKWHAPWKPYKVMAAHTGVVNTVIVDSSNEFFCSGSADSTIKIWDLALGKVKLTLTGHTSSVRSLAIDQRWPLLFSSSDDKQIFAWDLSSNNNAKVRSFFGHSSTITSLVLHPTLPLLFSAGRDKDIKAWDLRSPRPVMNLAGHLDGVASIAAQQAEPQLISSSFDLTIKLWDLKMAKCQQTLTHHSKPPRSVVIHPRLYSFASADSDVAKIWKLPECKIMGNYKDHKGSVINRLIVSDDDVLIGTGRDGMMYFWDYLSGHCFQHLLAPFPGCRRSEMSINDVTFDQSQSRLITACGDGTIKLFKVDSGVEKSEITWTRPQEDVFF